VSRHQRQVYIHWFLLLTFLRFNTLKNRILVILLLVEKRGERREGEVRRQNGEITERGDDKREIYRKREKEKRREKREKR
jgi:hypothetical protein